MTIEQSFRNNEPLAPFTAWRIGGPAHWFYTATSPDDMRRALLWATEHEVPLFVLGGGSNLLMSDNGWPGLVVRYRAAAQALTQRGEVATVSLGAGAPTAGTARKLAGQGWGGLEWAEGLPGTIGGAIYGNAGCYGGEIADVLLQATMLLPDGTIAQWQRDAFAFGYRSSTLKQLHGAGQPMPIVLSALLELHAEDPQRLSARMAEIAQGRKSRTPSGSSCGSVFKNPPGTTAGRLLDEAGLKGTRVGGAMVADKHANYIINTGGATANDVLQLAEKMQQEVERQFGITLELEVRVIGAQPLTLGVTQ